MYVCFRLDGSPITLSSLSERRLIRIYNAEPPVIIGPETMHGEEDEVSVTLLRRFNPVMLEIYSPRSAIGDGNCLYRAASLAMFGSQDHHFYLRLLTAMELIENKDSYDSPTRFDFLLPSYDQIVQNATKCYVQSDMVHMYALSAALSEVIQSYMPPTSVIDMGNPYTKLVAGRNVYPAGQARFTIMWTMMSNITNVSDFIPNHFVYLAKTSSHCQPESGTTNAPVEVASDCYSDDGSVPAALSTSYEKDVEPSSSDEGNEVLQSSADQTLDITASSSSPMVDGLYPLPDNAGLSTSAVLQLLQRCPSDVHIVDRIPLGLKNNVYCLVNNKNNVERLINGKNNVFDDDCGVWKSKGARKNTIPYLVEKDQPLKRLFLANSQYCREVQVRGKREYIPYDPQPDTSSVVTIVRYYATLSASDTYKRRISYLSDPKNDYAAAVIEYIGIHVNGQQHGNCKNAALTAPYVRTPFTTSAAISSMLPKMPVHQVYNDLKSSLDIDEAPRNCNVIRHQKAAESKKAKNAAGQLQCNNFADEYQAVFNMVQSDNFVRKFDCDQQRVPSVILYDNRQISDIKAFCFDGAAGSVLSFDKTFNLGNIYVTACVFKNLALQRRRTGVSPIFIGPIFLHGHSDIDTFAQFFSHLALRLRDCNTNQLVLGSDEELALRRCMSLYFPQSAAVLCTRHLHKNAVNMLENSIGSRSTVRKVAIAAIFGEGGLTSCTEAMAFDEKVETIRTDILPKSPPQFSAYFNSRLVGHLRSNVCVGLPKWTNNSCESINHVIKQYTQWRLQQLPDLVHKLKSLVQSQYAEADRALCGIGDFQLQPSYADHCLTINSWKEMTEAQRQRAVASCFRRKNSSTSTDGQLTVPTTPGGGKKPRQKKRARTERTTTSCVKAKKTSTTVHCDTDADSD